MSRSTNLHCNMYGFPISLVSATVRVYPHQKQQLLSVTSLNSYNRFVTSFLTLISFVAGQNKILYDNLRLQMEGKKPSKKYDGYTSCPLVTGYSKCILAEFDYDGKPLETLPINQAKERVSSFLMKKEIMPTLYWKLMLKYDYFS